jgi:PhnB protein
VANASSVKPIPDGYSTVTPYLYMKNCAKALDFYKAAFGAKEIMRIPGKNGQISHAEITIGDSRLMVSDEHPEFGALGPQSVGGTPIGLHIYVPNVDAVFQKAVDAGAKVDRPIQNQFYGDRTGTLIDPFGFKWYVATHVEEVSPDELKKRMANMSTQGQSAGG